MDCRTGPPAPAVAPLTTPVAACPDPARKRKSPIRRKWYTAFFGPLSRHAMKSTSMLFLLCLAAPLWAQNGNNLYSITADTVRSDSGSNVTTYEGNARAEVLDLVIEAESISVTGTDGSPSRIEASGSPLRFHRRQSTDELSGTAARIIFALPESKLTLTDYVIKDPSGNNMKGGKATFVLDP